MTNSDGGFQFDFQQPEKPVRPTVPPIPGQETAAYSTEPTAQATGSAVPAVCVGCAVCAAHTVCAARASSVCRTTHASCAARTSRSADAAHRSGHDATVLAAIPGCGCRTSTTAGGSHAASSIRNTTARCARPAAIRLGSDDAKLPPGGTDSASDASSTSRTSGTGGIACFGSFKRRDTGVPTQSGRAACGRCRGNTSVPA